MHVRLLLDTLLQALTGHTVRIRSILANAWGWRLVRTEVLANGFIKGGHCLLHISEKVLSLSNRRCCIRKVKFDRST